MGMSRPLTRTQALENRAFLCALRRTGNVRLACREVGLKYGTMQHRRSRHSAFAARGGAELVFFEARLNQKVKKGRHGSAAGALQCSDVSPDILRASPRHKDARSAPLT